MRVLHGFKIMHKPSYSQLHRDNRTPDVHLHQRNRYWSTTRNLGIMLGIIILLLLLPRTLQRVKRGCFQDQIIMMSIPQVVKSSSRQVVRCRLSGMRMINWMQIRNTLVQGT